MNARAEIQQILIAQKLQRWQRIALFPKVYPNCPPARARRNYWRLLAKYPMIAAKLNLSATSVYVR
jgi:hypothetical protein